MRGFVDNLRGRRSGSSSPPSQQQPPSVPGAGQRHPGALPVLVNSRDGTATPLQPGPGGSLVPAGPPVPASRYGLQVQVPGQAGSAATRGSGGYTPSHGEEEQDSHMEAAIAASLAAKVAEDADREAHSGGNALQDLAFFTDEPLPVPSGNLPAVMHGGAGTGAGHPSSHTSQPSAGRASGSTGSPSPLRRTLTAEDEQLARRLHKQWLAEERVATAELDQQDRELAELLTIEELATSGLVPDTSGVPGAPHGHDPACAYCGQAIARGHHHRRFMGRVWHPECFRCSVCGRAIAEDTFRMANDRPVHNHCARRRSSGIPHCKVCHEELPVEAGMFHFFRHQFFDDKYCPWHEESVRRCCSCLRLEPQVGGHSRGAFTELQDSRAVCMACAQTAVVDSEEAAPVYKDVCDFFQEELNLSVPKEMRNVPVLLVDIPTLNEQNHLDPAHGGATAPGIPTTRGLTLSEVATITHMAPGAIQFDPNQMSFVLGRAQRVHLGERREVTAILVLCGLPYSSTSSILAHEAMHAWIKLNPCMPSGLPPQVEEGVCQLVAWLWLRRLGNASWPDDGAAGATASSGARPLGGHGGGGGHDDDGGHGHGGQLLRRASSYDWQDPSTEDLRKFFVHQVETDVSPNASMRKFFVRQVKTDVSPVYGDGFRLAREAYNAVGLQALLDHVADYHAFPTV